MYPICLFNFVGIISGVVYSIQYLQQNVMVPLIESRLAKTLNFVKDIGARGLFSRNVPWRVARLASSTELVDVWMQFLGWGLFETG